MTRSNLAYFGGLRHSDPATMKFLWPRITDKTEKAILSQLHESISIYDRSSVFKNFEERFAEYHQKQFGLLFNSGTSAIHAMFDAIDLRPGDEVLCPVYSFHAAVSPLMSMGAIPIFCDTDEFGSITLAEIVRKVTSRTKGVVVTHMWGRPVPEIREIADFCSQHQLRLLEDCSHAHGAELNGKKLGTFGDAAAWSLQGQKVITGGEGGILLTDQLELYERALIFGHYNKRPQQELEAKSDLRPYYLTGKGLKLRAHPLAIAMALEQFEQIDEFMRVKRIHAECFDQLIDRYDFIDRPNSAIASESFYAYGFRYNKEAANGVTREDFVMLLHAEGLVEFDIPGSTGLLNELPLFTNPKRLYPALYEGDLPVQSGFESARSFYDSFIKLPVWAYNDDRAIVERYVSGFSKVADIIINDTDLAEVLRNQK